MRRFSKLKKKIESLFVPNLKLSVYCNVYHKPCYYGGSMEIPRFWMVLDKQIIFDFIKDFEKTIVPDPAHEKWGGRPVYWRDISDSITEILQAYIETPVNELLECQFDNDYFGLADILRAADRRIGKNRLILLMDKTESQTVKLIIEKRIA